MNEMLKTIEPKSDQLNADDLLGGRTITIKITSVAILPDDQPVALHYEGDNGKPYKPGKSMRRVIVTVWGSDAKRYPGQSMTLYRDDKVTFGSVAVGGIRISHMSGIDKDMTMALTATRAQRKPFTVRPLTQTETSKALTETSSRSTEAIKAPAPPPGLAKLLDEGNAAAGFGMEALRVFWERLGFTEKALAGGAKQLEEWKRTAKNVEAMLPATEHGEVK